MSISRPDRSSFFSLLSEYHRTNTNMKQWQNNIEIAMNSLFDNAKELHEAQVVSNLQKTPLPTFTATNSKPINSALQAVNIISLADLKKAIYTESNVAGLSNKICAKLRQFCTDKINEISRQTPLRIDFEQQSKLSTELVRTAIAWPTLEEAQNQLNKLESKRCQIAVQIAAVPLNRISLVGWLMTKKEQKAQIIITIDQLEQAIPELVAESHKIIQILSDSHPLSDSLVRTQFESDAASFYALFEKLDLPGTKPTKVAIDPFIDLMIDGKSGTVSSKKDALQLLVNKVNSVDYSNPLLKANLRGWQAFGVRYALTQKKVILGDEMGLGKTLQALGVITYLMYSGTTHALIVAPVGLLVNWRREIQKHTTLTPYVLHGDGRDRQLSAWRKSGGLALMNYDQVWRLPKENFSKATVIIADEAQMLLNPKTKRTVRMTTLSHQASYVMYMTGTPIQNKLEDIINLIRPLQPSICKQLMNGPDLYEENAFKRLIAPVYLRRNRTDVLKELPPLERITIWSSFSRQERFNYRIAISNKDFMGMRQAAWIPEESANESPKRMWLINFAKEMVENGHRVLIFSYFHRALSLVSQDLAKVCLPPITGHLSMPERQIIIDQFTASQHGQVLCAQIQTLGQGLNLQTADTVVFCEPQLTPAIEEQAISRVYRMGQTRPVTVYKLLTEHSIDQLIQSKAIIKQELFDQFAKDSVIANATNEAKAFTNSALLTQLVNQATTMEKSNCSWDKF